MEDVAHTARLVKQIQARLRCAVLQRTGQRRLRRQSRAPILPSPLPMSSHLSVVKKKGKSGETKILRGWGRRDESIDLQYQQTKKRRKAPSNEIIQFACVHTIHHTKVVSNPVVPPPTPQPPNNWFIKNNNHITHLHFRICPWPQCRRSFHHRRLGRRQCRLL